MTDLILAAVTFLFAHIIAERSKDLRGQKWLSIERGRNEDFYLLVPSHR